MASLTSRLIKVLSEVIPNYKPPLNNATILSKPHIRNKKSYCDQLKASSNADEMNFLAKEGYPKDGLYMNTLATYATTLYG